MIAGTRSVYFLYCTGSSTRQGASQYAANSNSFFSYTHIAQIHRNLLIPNSLVLSFDLSAFVCCSIWLCHLAPKFCSMVRHFSTPTILVYSSNGVPLPTSFSSSLLRSARASCMVFVTRNNSVMPYSAIPYPI